MSKVLSYLHFEWRRLTPALFIRELFHRFRRNLILRFASRLPRLFQKVTSQKELLAFIGAENRAGAMRILRSRHAPPFFISAEQAQSLIRDFRKKFPGVEKEIITEADFAVRHMADLLGSGLVHLGDRIAWQKDFKTGFTFPKVHHGRVPVYGLPGGADIKVPWELSRCMHFVPLGQAYWFTGSEDYAREIRNQIITWIKDNPPGRGCNWACSMDVALRVSNWAWGYSFIRYSPCCDDEFLVLLMRSLRDHGLHIMANLEKTPTFTGNHYAADLLGLAYLGLLFPEIPEAEDWKEFARKELEAEVVRQTHPDGVNYEASIPYHRLATELFLYPWLLFQASGVELSETYRQRLEGMLDTIHHTMNTSGNAPTVGDCDDGRVHLLAPVPINSHGYLLSIGARVFNKPRWRRPEALSESFAYWALAGLPLKGCNWEIAEEREKIPGSKAFPDGGLYAMRRGDVHLLCDAGGVGQNGRGGHGHHDALSVVLSVGDTWVLRDPGTGVYSADPEVRNRHRATASHNTVVVDGMEQGTLLPQALFLLGDEARPQVDAWESDEACDRLVAHHDGFLRKGKGKGARHEREVYFDKELGFYRITDTLTGKGSHDFRQAFHFGDVEIVPLKGAATLLSLMGQQYFAKSHLSGEQHLREDLCRMVEYPDFRLSILYFGPEEARCETGAYTYSETYGVFAEGTVLTYESPFTDKTTSSVLFAIEF